MKVKELRLELTERGLTHTGNKPELVERLLLHFRELVEENGQLPHELPPEEEYSYLHLVKMMIIIR